LTGSRPILLNAAASRRETEGAGTEPCGRAYLPQEPEQNCVPAYSFWFFCRPEWPPNSPARSLTTLTLAKTYW